MIAIPILLGLLALLWLWLLISPAHRATYRDRLDASTQLVSQPTLPPVTVILAARNEAAILPQTLPTICQQQYPDLRVIVVDDQSDDDSPAVLEALKRAHPNLESLRAADRPAGWIGKSWALQCALTTAPRIHPQAPPERLLLFTDADIFFHPDAVRQAVLCMQARNLDMLSLLPRCICQTPIERLGEGGLMTLLSLMFPIGWANDPTKRGCALACGAFMLVRPDAYQKVGGHACVRSHLIEDMNLAKHLKQSGAAVAVHNTRDLVQTRMYDGFADLWEGLTKNAYAGMEYQPRKFWVGLLAVLVAGILPPVYLLLTLLWCFHARSGVALAACGFAILINICMTLVHARTTRHMGLPLLYAFSLPASLLLYTLIAIDSAIQHHYRGGNAWKGRRYDRKTLVGPLIENTTFNVQHPTPNVQPVNIES